MNLQTLRDYIRAQLDMDEEELPNGLLDAYLNEAFLRTISMEVNWPFYETRWEISTVVDQPTVPLPTDCDPPGVMSLVDLTTGIRLMQLSNELAEDNFIGMSAKGSYPCYYSLEGRDIVLWPGMMLGAASRSYRLRGHRIPIDWITTGASAEPDCDVRLHQLLAHYAIALCYAQQEDEVLEDVYMKRWQASFVAAHSAICAPRHHRPLILNGGVPYVPAYVPVGWSDPPVHP